MFEHLRRFSRGFGGSDAIVHAVNRLTHTSIQTEVARRVANYSNPLGKAGGKTFSQSDEDGIIAEILRRLGIERGTYCEFGVGDGLECNTLALAAQGWRGFWIGGEPLAFSPEGIDRTFFNFEHAWVDLENVVDLYRRNLALLNVDQVDVLSFDLDSRDLFFLERLLEAGVRARLIIAEYNATFLPPVRWSVAPNDASPWMSTNYFGASLASFVDLFDSYSYRLVACNPATGANAFFVHNKFSKQFLDIPQDIQQLYVPPYFDLHPHGHRNDPRVARRALEIGARIAAGVKWAEFPTELTHQAVLAPPNV